MIDFLYKFRKILSDIQSIMSGSAMKIFKRFFIRKPLYKEFMKWIRKI